MTMDPEERHHMIEDAFKAYASGEKLQDIADRYQVPPADLLCDILEYQAKVDRVAREALANRYERQVLDILKGI